MDGTSTRGNSVYNTEKTALTVTLKGILNMWLFNRLHLFFHPKHILCWCWKSLPFNLWLFIMFFVSVFCGNVYIKLILFFLFFSFQVSNTSSQDILIYYRIWCFIWTSTHLFFGRMCVIVRRKTQTHLRKPTEPFVTYY